MCLSAGALPRKLPRCARPAFANFVCYPCVVTTAYDRHHDNPLSRDSPPRQPYRRPPCPKTNPVLYPVFMPCPTTAPLAGAVSQVPVVRQLPVAVSVVPPCRPVLFRFRPQWMFFRPCDVTTPLSPRVRRFVPFVSNKDEGDRDVGQKDVGPKDGAPQGASSREFPLMSGEETTDPVPCGSAVVPTPSDAAWDSKGATVYYKRAVTNFCDSEGHLKPRDVKMPIAVNSSAWDGTGALAAVVRCTTQPRGGGKTKIKEQFLVQAP